MIKSILYVVIFWGAPVYALEISVGAQARAPIAVGISILGESVHKVDKLVNQLKLDLEFSNQIKIDSVNLNAKLPIKEHLQNLAQKHLPLAILFNSSTDLPNQFEWRLYDLLALKMLAGKKVSYQGDLVLVAHDIATQVWQQLMGEPGVFNSVIVACQKQKNESKPIQYIYAFHPTRGTEFKKLLVGAPTINFAPRWHPSRRLLYFSQYTPKNVRLMSFDEYGKQRVVTDFSGLNLTPTISAGGQILVSLSSGGCEKLYRYDFDQEHKSSKFTALTDCRMHAIAPSFIDEERVVFCGIDAFSKIPRIVILNIKQHTATFLTGKAFCVSPSYSSAKDKIVYCKKVNGIQQLFCYDLSAQEHEQLTSSLGDKDDCSWSPCGNYIVFTEYNKKDSRIAIFSWLDRNIFYLSPKGESWCFPAWSPRYDDRLFIKC